MRRGRGRGAHGWTGPLVVGAVSVIALVGSLVAVPPSVSVEAPEVRVPAAARTLVCPGPLVLPTEAAAGDGAFDPTPGPTLTRQRLLAVAGTPDQVGRASLTPLAGGAPLVDLAAQGTVVVGDAADVTSATVLRAEPAGGDPAVAGGASASVTAAGDLRGLAAASCRPPSASTWLVGGSTAIGSSSLLVVANPGRTPAEVSVQAYGPSGPVETPGATFLVAPGAERALLLEGVAAEQRRLTVHVTAAGGLVAAHLQDSRLDGFTPAGTDLVTAGVAPANRQVVGGLVVPESPVEDTDAAVVRLLAPGEDPATVSLTLLGLGGAVRLPGAEQVRLGAGEVTDVSLAGLPAGAYTAVVESAVPVVAAAMLTRRGPAVELGDIPTLERAWIASTEPGAGGVVPLPDGVAGTVVVGAVGASGSRPDGAAGGTLRVLGTDGAVLAEQPLSVVAGTTGRFDPAALAAGRAVAAVELVPDVVPADVPGDVPADAPADVPGDEAAAGPLLAWSVLATVGSGPDEMVSVLTPVPPPPEQPSVRVRQAARLGLP